MAVVIGRNVCYVRITGPILSFVGSQVARRLSLIKHPQCSNLSGGQAIELLAKDGDRTKFNFRTPMGQTHDCCFSFAGLRNQVTMTIMKKEAEEGNPRSSHQIHLFPAMTPQNV